MSAFTLYLALHRAGLQIATDGEQLIVVPADKLTDELRAAIRQHKSGLIELLQSAHHTAGCFLNWVVDLDPNTSAATAIKFRTASLELDRDVQDFIDKAGGKQE